MLQPTAAGFRFGEFTLDVARARLCRGDSAVALRPKSFALLEYLVTHAGRVIGKDELLAAIWPGLVVTEDSLTRCVSEVRSALGDDAQRAIKTVTKRGYLFDAPVIPLADEAVQVQVSTEPLHRSSAPVQSRRRGRWLALAAALLVLATVFVTRAWVMRGDRAEPPRLSIVVLPFATLGDDRVHEYLADVVADDLTMALSRVSGVTVIASTSASTFKEPSRDLRQVGVELGVRYAVQGSVMRSGERLRISVKLVDLRSQTALWSDQFDVERGELLRTQDDIAARLANALDAELVLAESRRPPLAGTSLDAEDLAMRCEATWLRLGAEGDAQGREQCERALRLDPSNVRALVQLASWHAIRVSRVQSSDPLGDVAQAREFVDRAMTVAPGNYAVHCAKARVLETEQRIREAIVEAKQCARLNPSHAGAYLLLAIDHFFLAQPNETLDFVQRAIRISPRDPRMPVLLTFKGWAHFQLRQDEEAVAWFRQALASAPENPTALAALASALALTGHDAEARAAMARYLGSRNARTRTIAQWNYGPDDNEAFREFSVRFKEGLRRAGMPER